jgi:hypothetical protein
MRKFVVSVLVLSIILATLWNMHSKVITKGEFYGLKIGMTKPEVISILSVKPVTAVFSGSETPLTISSKNVTDILLLNEFDLIMVRHKEKLWTIALSEDVVVKISVIFGGTNLPNISVGESRAVFLQKIAGLMNLDDAYSAVGKLVGYGADGQTSVNLSGGSNDLNTEGVLWLQQQDTWSFNLSSGYKRYVLKFLKGRLSIIEYTNYFIDLP